jgi:tetratricopeptide (TPR) repeat protein
VRSSCSGCIFGSNSWRSFSSEEGHAAGLQARATRDAATCLRGLGAIARDEGRTEEALTFAEESLQALREIGDLSNQAITLGLLSALAQQRGDATQALALSQEGLLLARAVHNRKEIADALATAGHRAREQNDLAQALIYYHECLEHYQALDTTSGVAAW